MDCGCARGIAGSETKWAPPSRRARHRFAQQRADEAQVALRSRMQQIQPPKLFVLIAPRNVGEFLSFEETPLGEGGFGTVFRGRPTPAGCKLVPELRPSKSYAVKMVKKTEKGGAERHLQRRPLTAALAAHGRWGTACVALVGAAVGGCRADSRRGVRRRFFNLGSDEKDNVVGLVYDERMAKHRNLEDSSHPEQPKRVLAVFEHLQSRSLAKRCTRVPAREATREELLLKHSQEHVDAMLGVRNLSESEAIKLSQQFDSVFLCPESTEAGLLAAGSVLEATARVCAGELQSAVCVVRPPGHHAEPKAPRGFCLFGNVGLAAAHAQSRGLSQRTLVVDFDVHHGNGTQRMFEEDSSVLFLSVHRYDRGTYYPGGQLGNYTSHGRGEGEGYTVNIPWEVEKNKTPPGDPEMLYAFERVFMPIARAFDPDLVLVSAGFDAAPGDPLGGCRVSPTGFFDITKELMSLADGKVVLAQEGGYNVESNSESMAACVSALLGEEAPSEGQLPGFNVVDERNTKPADMSHVATVETIGYSLLSVSPERHLDFMNAMTGRGPFENGTWARALHYMHRTIGALHRDIKPENFGFIKPPTAGQPLPALKLFDMGLAWVLKAPVTEETAKKMLHVKRCGTACYMAPEVWDGHTGPPSDVWSLGVVSFITVSLEVPFKLMEHKQPKLAVRDNELSFESRAWADASDQSKQFLQGLLDKVPSSRLTTGEALAHCWLTASLEPIAEGASPDNGVLPPLTERRLPARSRRSEAGLFESMAMAPESMLAGEVAT
ncbi:unnamed protein product [Effrenium voratum]|nr:unnamed protein product [Effrenium voratum]